LNRFLGIFLAVSALSACNDPQSKSKTAPSAAPTSSAIPDDFVVNSFFGQSKVALAVDGSAAFGEPGSDTGGADVKNKLLDPGGDPKVKLAYNLVLNKTQSVVATVTEEISGPDIPEGQGKQPPLKLTMALTPKKKLDGGKTQVELKIAKFEMVGAPADMAAKLAPLQASLQKVTASFTVQPNGETGDLDFAGAEGLQRGGGEQILSMLARVQTVLYVPLPAAAIGPGARWKSSTTSPQEGASVDSTYTFVAKSDVGYEIKLETLSLTAPKVMQDPRTGKKISIEIKGGSNYTLTTLLDGPTFKVNGNSKTDIVMSEGGGPKRSNNEKMTLTIEKPAK